MELQHLLKSKNEKLFDIFRGNLAKIDDLLLKCTPIEYTFHDKEKHCQTLETYCFQLIPDKLKQKLSDDEIFILLNGIYYHDIGMSSYFTDELGRLQVNRNRHNLIARDKIYNFDSSEYNPKLIAVPDKIYAKSIAWLCYAHRDYWEEREEGNRKISTLESCPIIEPYRTEVHTQFLSCILRLADELDITYSRAPEDIFNEIKDFLPEKSKEEWQTHAFFRSVIIKASSFRIRLYPNTDEIVAREKNGVDRTLIRKMIFSKVNKIQRELELLQNYFSKYESDQI